MNEDVLKELKQGNALLRRIINQLGAQHIKRMEFYKEWREHIKAHDEMGKELKGDLKGIGNIFKDLSPEEMRDMAKYTTKELQKKFEDDEEFKKKLKGLR